jgi:hypothetical protein
MALPLVVVTVMVPPSPAQFTLVDVSDVIVGAGFTVIEPLSVSEPQPAKPEAEWLEVAIIR